MFSKRNVRIAALWSGIEALSSVVLSLISIVYLARILHPTDYGNIAMAQVIAGLVGLIFSFGFAEAIIQRKEINDEVKATAFLASVFFCVCTLLVSFATILILHFFIKEQVVIYIFMFEIAGVIFTLLSILPTALLLRQLKMSAFTKRTLISRGIFFVITVPLASYGYGIWSVVFGNLAQSFVSMVLLFIATRKEMPRKINFNFLIFKDLFGFGIYVMAENILWSVLSRVFSLLIASFQGTYALGLYNMATKITDAVLNVMNTVVSRMALPLFSQVQDDNQKLRNIFARTTKLFNVISMPAFFGMAITCSEWVPVILGNSWSNAIPVIQIIAVMYAIMYSRMFVGTAMKAVGQSKRFMILSAISAVLSIVTVLITRNMSLIDTMIYWAVVRVAVTIPIGIFLMQRILKMDALEQLKPVFVPLFSSLVMGTVLLFLDRFVELDKYGFYLNMTFVFLIGFISYIIPFMIATYINNMISGESKWKV
ncbi:oligosaccharide flippase family protein [Raoultella ornithinolytica]|uniref:oligosaccharide flippase family protein n=1 Tax=Raoultella ornithinolytica TaxID=54291 RepID=UPI002A5A25CE|nr:oligosaccharide flippase family protein [Raoultella ornithinolytica]WPO25346.1 oligosaccharide flippase family protein [Raoultella ornithinolytica]